MRKKLLPPAVLLLLVFACQAQPSPHSDPTTAGGFLPPAYTAAPTPTATHGFTGEFDLPEALELLYRAEGTLETDSQGEPVIRIKGVPGSDDPRDKIIKPLLTAPYREAGEEKYILLTETGPEGMGAHAEYAQIGGALFHIAGNSWQIEIEQRGITGMGSFGHAPKGELLSIGPDRHGYLFEPQWAGQGSAVQTAYLIGVVGPEFALIFTHQTTMHGEMENLVWDYSSTMEFIPGRVYDYYDIRMTTRGMKPVEGKVVSFEEVEVFEFNGREYVLVGPKG